LPGNKAKESVEVRALLLYTWAANNGNACDIGSW
jgi:hypothetical protein